MSVESMADSDFAGKLLCNGIFTFPDCICGSIVFRTLSCKSGTSADHDLSADG